ncbi:MAG TPA: hypothetical protein DCZ94_10945 [Lentisphaeria bacterium]|nr:MAG: hypothetical protein A2X48_06825 [Lentisphaerae bacterium GWF2_49_21]HBC87462.1 hypothetical protein [Lentisphaeria bacterium]
MDKIKSAIRANTKAVIGLIIASLLFMAVLILYWKDIMNLWPGHDTISSGITALGDFHKDLEKEIKEVHDIRLIRENFVRQGKDFWISKRDGDIESSIIKKIEDVAKSSGLKLQNIGNSRLTKINEDISFMEVNIEAKSTMEEISKFISDLYKANPCFYWRKCVIRPFNPRDAKEIVLSGTISVVSLNSDYIAKVLMGEEK